jgi:hypothetical protein
MDELTPPSDLPESAFEVTRLWAAVKDDTYALMYKSLWPTDWDPYKLGEALAVVAADFVHEREREHRNPEQLKDDSDNLRLGLTNGLSRAHVAHHPARYDEWGCPFKTRFVNLGDGKDSVLAKDFPELFARVADDETAICYYPKLREFGIPVLDGGPSVIIFSHDPFSGKPLPKGLGTEWRAAVESALGREYSWGDTVPEEFRSEAWWIARNL